MPLRFDYWRKTDHCGMTEGYQILAGGQLIGDIVKIDRLAGERIYWTWTINRIAMRDATYGVDHGSEKTATEAKRSAEYAWSMWVSAAGLRERSNAAPD